MRTLEFSYLMELFFTVNIFLQPAVNLFSILTSYSFTGKRPVETPTYHIIAGKSSDGIKIMRSFGYLLQPFPMSM